MGSLQDYINSGRSFSGIRELNDGTASRVSDAGYRDLGNGNFKAQGRWWEAPISGAEMQQKIDARDFARRQSNPDNMLGSTNYIDQIRQYLTPSANTSELYGKGGSGVGNDNPYEQRLAELINNPDDISKTNAYKFRFNQGQQALERSAAAKGMLNSGNTLAELANYGQGAASQEYGNEFGRLAGMTGERNQFNLGLKNAANQEFGMRSGLDQNRAGVALSALTTANDQRLKANQLATAAATGTNFVSPKIW